MKINLLISLNIDIILYHDKKLKKILSKKAVFLNLIVLNTFL
jgi:hypothetical protein